MDVLVLFKNIIKIFFEIEMELKKISKLEIININGDNMVMGIIEILEINEINEEEMGNNLVSVLNLDINGINEENEEYVVVEMIDEVVGLFFN